MVSKFLNKKSKRQSAKTRYKIQKKAREHKRKTKREDKLRSKKRRKDPGIPNSLPFKETVLKEAEERKLRIEEEKQKRREKRVKDRARELTKKRNLESVLKDAQKRTADYEKRKGASTEVERQASGKAVETSLKTFYKEFKKVVDAADVILEVLDARDPLGSRCGEMEEAIISSGTNKRLVFILNKIDLVPRENVEAWLKHLRNEFPAIAFKASTQTQSDNLSQTRVPVLLASDDLLKSSRCIGADLLMKLLGNYCRNKDIKSTIRVGVVGFPNTGKSSIINSLKRSRACNVGSMPGITRTMQEVHLDKHIKLLDSPGVVMATGKSDMSVILRNCVKLESLEDSIGPVEAILKRCPKEKMMIHYKLSDYSNTSEFLSLLAKRLGKLKKGGVPDVNKAAKSVLQDWTNGKITYYTQPPEQHTMPTHVSATIVEQMGREFNLEELHTQEKQVLEGLQPTSSKHMLVESLGTAKIVMCEDDLNNEEEEEEEEEMDSEDEEEKEDMEGSDVEEEEVDALKGATVSVHSKSKHSKSPQSKVEMLQKLSAKQKRKKSAKVSKEDKEKKVLGLIQLNKNRKQDFKKMKKQRKRADKVATSLSDAMTGALKF